jgi:hypothetical protein
MYLSAERLAVANKEVQETFEQTSVAWQAIPHWYTDDPAQTMVRNDSLTAPGFLPLGLVPIDFEVTLAEAIAPTPDAMLAKVIANTVKLAAAVDNAVFPALLTATTPAQHIPAGPTTAQLLDGLIEARAKVEKAAYRSPSCLVTDTASLKMLSAFINGNPGTDALLPPANINSLHRVETLASQPDVRGWLLGRRQRIAHGGASAASPGEEAVDLCVSVPPSLEVVGDTSTNTIKLRVRISYVVRVKDEGGLVVFRTP